MKLSADLARWTDNLDLRDVPAEVAVAARRHLLDGFSTAVAAARLDATPVPKVAAELGGPPEANIIGSDRRLSAVAAALANGALVHALDFDDTHSGGLVHPTAVVLPTVLAVGQQVGASGPETLAAAVAGYEVVCRVAAAAPHQFHARGAHPTSVCGAVAAAAVAGKLMRLGHERIADALGIVTSQASGVMEFLRSGGTTKQLHPGWAAASGILAARLAAAGMQGPARPLDGEFGLFRVFAQTDVNIEQITTDLGRSWETTRITIKPYPACQLIHAALDAAADLRGQVGNPDRLIEVVAEIPPGTEAIVCSPYEQKISPDAPYGAKFSLPWTVAAMLIDGRVDADTFTPAQLERADIRRLAASVGYRVKPFTGNEADAPGRLVATMSAGDQIEATVERSSGSPDKPLSDRELKAKVVRNVGDRQLARSLTKIVAGPGPLPPAEDIGRVVGAGFTPGTAVLG